MRGVRHGVIVRSDTMKCSTSIINITADTSEIELLPQKDFISHEKTHTVTSLDVMALGRILNFISRQKEADTERHYISSKWTEKQPIPKHIGFSPFSFSNRSTPASYAKKELPLGNIDVEPFESQGSSYFDNKYRQRVQGLGKKYKATIRLSTLQSAGNIMHHGPFIAVGIALNDKDAKVAAAMHAEMILSHFSVPIFSSSRLQKKYESDHPPRLEVPSCVIFDSRKLPADRALFVKFSLDNDSCHTQAHDGTKRTTANRVTFVKEGNVICNDAVVHGCRSSIWSIVPIRGDLASPYIGRLQSFRKITSLLKGRCKSCRDIRKYLHVSRKIYGMQLSHCDVRLLLHKFQKEVENAWNEKCYTLNPHSDHARSMTILQDDVSCSALNYHKKKGKMLKLRKARLRIPVSNAVEGSITVYGYGCTARDALLAAAINADIRKSVRMGTSSKNQEHKGKPVCIFPINPPQLKLNGYYREVIVGSNNSAYPEEKFRCKFAVDVSDVYSDAIYNHMNSILHPFLSSSNFGPAARSFLENKYLENETLIGKCIDGPIYRCEIRSQNTAQIIETNGKEYLLCGVGVAPSREDSINLARLHLFDQEMYGKICSKASTSSCLNGALEVFHIPHAPSEIYAYNPFYIDFYTVKISSSDIPALRPSGPCSHPICIENYSIIPPSSQCIEGNFYSSTSITGPYIDALGRKRVQSYFHRLGLDMRDFISLRDNESDAVVHQFPETETRGHPKSLSLQFSAENVESIFDLQLHKLHMKDKSSIGSRCSHKNHIAQCLLPLPLSENVLLFRLSVENHFSCKSAPMIENNPQPFRHMSVPTQYADVSHLRNVLCRELFSVQGKGIGHSASESIQLLSTHLDMLLHSFRIRLFSDPTSEKKRNQEIIYGYEWWKFFDSVDKYLKESFAGSIRMTKDNVQPYVFFNASCGTSCWPENSLASPLPPLPLRYECEESVRWMKYLQQNQKNISCHGTSNRPKATRFQNREKIADAMPRRNFSFNTQTLSRMARDNLSSNSYSHRFQKRSEATCAERHTKPTISSSLYQRQKIFVMNEKLADKKTIRRVSTWFSQNGYSFKENIRNYLISPLWYAEISVDCPKNNLFFQARGSGVTRDKAKLAACIHCESILFSRTAVESIRDESQVNTCKEEVSHNFPCSAFPAVHIP